VIGTPSASPNARQVPKRKTSTQRNVMKKMKTGLVIIGTIAAVGLITPALVVADQPPTAQQDAPGKAQPFHGKVESVDSSAKTFNVVGKLIYIAETTRLTSEGKAITLADIKNGDAVSGTTRQTFDGKTEAITVKVAPEEKK